MAKDLISRYVWIVDTISRYGRLTREELNRLWVESRHGDGKPMPERTFYHHRRAIEENFHIELACDREGAYYIVEEPGLGGRTFSDWLLDSYAVSGALSESAEVAGKVMLENVPSAREFLPTALEAIKSQRKIRFTYAGFNRSREEREILFSPYFVRLYRQRWYMVGRREATGDTRTYALDRVRGMSITADTFEPDPHDSDPQTFFANLLGITSSKAEVRTVQIQTTPTQAKYLRALPLHETQQETVHDFYSIFTYRLKLNYELVHEIMALGSAATVLAPKELKAMVKEELQTMLRSYS